MKFPNHVAIIMDGNRRWAQVRGLPPLDGHRAGVESMHSTIEYLGNHHLKYLTIYGFSTENWGRDPDEIEGLFQLYAEVLNKESHELYRRGVRLRHVGHLDELPPYVQLATNRAVDLTKNNTGMMLSFAFNYGGSIEIIDAVRRLIDEGLPSHLVDENLFSRYLYTDGMPDVDLVIRTAGELRLSNFLIWQTRYSEFYFTQTLWPNFDTEELEKALEAYSQRRRRFGGD